MAPLDGRAIALCAKAQGLAGAPQPRRPSRKRAFRARLRLGYAREEGFTGLRNRPRGDGARARQATGAFGAPRGPGDRRVGAQRGPTEGAGRHTFGMSRRNSATHRPHAGRISRATVGRERNALGAQPEIARFRSPSMPRAGQNDRWARVRQDWPCSPVGTRATPRFAQPIAPMRAQLRPHAFSSALDPKSRSRVQAIRPGQRARSRSTAQRAQAPLAPYGEALNRRP